MYESHLVIYLLVVIVILFYYSSSRKEGFYLLNQYNQTRSDPATDNNIYTFRGTDMSVESPTFDMRERELQKISYRDHDVLSRKCEFC